MGNRGHIIELNLGVTRSHQTHRTQVVKRFDCAFNANDQRLLTSSQSASTVVAIVGDQGLAHIGHGHAHGSHLGGVRDHLKSSNFAT